MFLILNGKGECVERGFVRQIHNDIDGIIECKFCRFIAIFGQINGITEVDGLIDHDEVIDHLIDACLEAGINEIYIVRGYLAEQFDQLLYKYPMIKFLENPVYNEANNISSSLVARHMLSNAYVFEADLLISNPAIIKKYHYTSDFLAIKKDRTDDWCFEVKDGVIVEEKVGGENCWQMVGISYWNESDGNKLSDDISTVYSSPGGKERYWEQVPLVYCKDHYAVEVRECFDEDIVEIDTFNELKKLDPSYAV